MERLAAKSNIPVPKLYVVQTWRRMLCHGRNPNHARLRHASLLQIMSDDELKASSRTSFLTCAITTS